MPHPGEVLGQDVKEPTTDELVGVKFEDAGCSGGGVDPEQLDAAPGVVAEKTLGVEGTAMDITGQVAARGPAFSSRLELDVPPSGGTERAGLSRGECPVDVGMFSLQGALDEAAEAVCKRAEVDEELVGLYRADEPFAPGGA